MRVSENSSVSVDMVAGFDLVSFNSVGNQTHFSDLISLLCKGTIQRVTESESESVTFDFNIIEFGPTHTDTSSIIIHLCFSTQSYNNRPLKMK